MTRKLTEMPLDDGHVWNTLVTVVIAHTVKFLGGDINGGDLRSRVATHLAVDLRNQYKGLM